MLNYSSNPPSEGYYCIWGQQSWVFKLLRFVIRTSDSVKREQYYLNILFSMPANPRHDPVPGMAGPSILARCKHTESTRHKLSEINTGSNHPMFGRAVTDETRQRMSVARILIPPPSIFDRGGK